MKRKQTIVIASVLILGVLAIAVFKDGIKSSDQLTAQVGGARYGGPSAGEVSRTANTMRPGNQGYTVTYGPSTGSYTVNYRDGSTCTVTGAGTGSETHRCSDPGFFRKFINIVF